MLKRLVQGVVCAVYILPPCLVVAQHDTYGVGVLNLVSISYIENCKDKLKRLDKDGIKIVLVQLL